MKNKSSILWHCLLVFVLLFAFACDEGGDEGGDADDADGGPSSTATLTITNSTSFPIWYVFVYQASDSTIGDDLLGGTETIEIGSSRTFNVDAGTYTVRVDSADLTGLDECSGFGYFTAFYEGTVFANGETTSYNVTDSNYEVYFCY